jgi:hypothetical protein
MRFVPALHQAAKCWSGRLPRIIQRDAFTLGFSIRLRPAHRAAERWVVPGSRLLPYVSARFMTEQIREGDETRAKAAPLQALDDHARYNVRPFRRPREQGSTTPKTPPPTRTFAG